MTARALWLGPGAARALHGPGTVEIALHPGGYIRFGDDYALLAHPRAPRGPLTILVAGLESAPLRPGDAAHAEAGHLHVGAHDIALDMPPAAPAPPTPLHPGWHTALTAALESAPDPPPELTPGLTALRTGDLEHAIAELAGRGPGLTPAGDDILAGYAAWPKAHLNTPVPPGTANPPPGTVPGCSPIGLAYLRCAERGELPEPAARVLAAVRRGDVAGARRAARALGAWGASSGAAILWGLASAT